MLHIPAPQEFRAAFSESLRGSVRKIRESDDYDTWLNANISDVSLVETDWQRPKVCGVPSMANTTSRLFRAPGHNTRGTTCPMPSGKQLRT
jgi:hypothetical protein